MPGPSMTRRNLITGCGAGILAAGLGPARGAWAATAVGFQLSWLHSVQFAGSYIAQKNGWWHKAGLDVTLMQGGPNAPVEPPVVAGNALVGISAADYTASAVAQGADFRIIGVAMQKNPFVIASLPENPVNTPADLPGRRIGMALANTPVLKALCSLNGVDFDAITIVPTQYSAQPLVAGEVDCLLCWETDLPVAMLVNGLSPVTMLMADHGYALHSQTYIATGDSLLHRRRELVALMAGEIRGWDAYRADTDAAAELTMAMFPDAGLDAATQKLQARRQVPLMFSQLTDAQGFGWFDDGGVEANIRTLGLLGHKVAPALWDRSILEEIRAG
jgi:ABC-type nitrate/sulfonate/bicarbonate transport system substrate-binding protein